MKHHSIPAKLMSADFGPRRGGPHRRDRGFGPGGFGPDMSEEFGPMHGRGFGRGRRGPGRGRRGDVRNGILALLTEEPRNGYQIMSEIEKRTDGLWRPSAGSVYPALGLLQDEGLIEQLTGENGKAFSLTDAGRNYAEEHAEDLTDPWAKVAQPLEGYLDVRREVGALALALKQVVLTGDKAQVEAARGVLDEARRGIYRILAGDQK